ncbi:hypothetical protein [Sinorhizobium saheli]|uniref:Glycosyltransferase RgtA/B/C/D-like domain-containing protein n=1 Tax=Sinorhizobium saheli TaxID=36856 RepID=A0A178YSR1_SINSA|nr:hypothetical protein [Sinorhizobium saheli]MQW86418.1 hypothetical protein [Sinorhizobium saheli]OAP50494.1 hypothetical protein ATB98_14935 [Sinorhizobium saheli]
MIRFVPTKKQIEYFIAGSFIIAGMFGVMWIFITQDPVQVSNGLGWDGVYYDRLLRFLAAEDGLGSSIAFPYCARVGTPWILVNILNNRFGFYGFNIVASGLFSATLLLATRSLWHGSIKGLTAVIAASTFLYFAPLKFTSFYPAYMDPPFLLILAFCLVFILKKNYFLASIICIAGIPFREASFYVLPLLVTFYLKNTQRDNVAWLTSVSIIMLGYALKELMLLVSDCESQSQLFTALFWFYRFLSEPTHVLGSFAAISLTLGPLYVVLDKQTFNHIKSDDTVIFSVVASVYVGILSIIGGSDVTRIFYSFLPLYVPLLIKSFRVSSPTSFALACFGWLLTNHMLQKYEQPISEGPNSDISGFFAQFPDYAHPTIALVVLGIWIILAMSRRLIEPLVDGI